MLEKTWRYKTIVFLLSLTLALQLSLPGWFPMTTANTAQESSLQFAFSNTTGEFSEPLAVTGL